MSRVAARRYAQALFELAQESGELEAVKESVDQIRSQVETTPALAWMLKHPTLAPQAKRACIDNLFGDHGRLLMNFLNLLVDKGRENLLPDIFTEFRDIVLEAEGVIAGELTLAAELPDQLVESIAERLSSATGRQVRLSTSVDESLIGGMVVRLGDLRFDASMSHHLQNLRRRMTGAGSSGKGVS